MSILEEKIKRNKDWFDKNEPPPGHLDRFRNKLSDVYPEKETRRRTFSIILKIAASVILVVAITFFVVQLSSKNQMLASAAVSDQNLPEELKELRLYYNHINAGKIETIETYTCDENDPCEELKEIAKHELKELENNTVELEKELEESNNNGRVMSAIVNNYQLMSKVLDNVIASMNKTSE